MEEVLNLIFQNSPADSQIESLIISDLKTYSKYSIFDSQTEVKILQNYYKDILDFSKNKLFLQPPKLVEFFKLSNSLIIAGTIKRPRASIPDLKNIITSYSSSFNPSDLFAISSFFSNNYFQNVRLYNHIFSSQENRETMHIISWIDEPLPITPLNKSVQRLKNKLPVDETDTKIVQRSRTKLVSSRRGNDSKEPLQDFPADIQESEAELKDPLEEKLQKLHVDMEAEFQKRESLIDQEIDDLRKRYR